MSLIGGALVFAALAADRLELLPWGLSLMMAGSMYRFFALSSSKRAEAEVKPGDD